jgi:hypothetical protein
VQAVRSRCSLCDPETEVPGTSSVSLWTQEQVAEVRNIKGRTFGSSVLEKWRSSASVLAIWVRPVEP